MNLIFALIVLAILAGFIYSLACVIYPFWKIRTRRQALVGIIASSFAIIVAISFLPASNEQDASDVTLRQQETGERVEETGTAPLAELDLTDYLMRCKVASEADFNRDCLGKKVVWVLFFAGTGQPMPMLNPDGYDDTYFNVSFAELPDWGDSGASYWTGRRVSVSATIAKPESDSAVVLENARVIPDESWRDRAVEMVAARDDVLAAIWPQPGGVSFWVTMWDNGQRDYDASQMCGALWRAGRPADFRVAVSVLNAARIGQQADVIGKATCSGHWP